ncbi:MAG: translation initiation factor IF-2 N-terminal domain-containing protein, partial [Gemmatimonadales bacterium]|nr:translation initiation factor IF-2 N-terminal domain-containing protein [Gemmatimonadales bacterium]
MGKTRIHDLAVEFGIESGELIKLLADMGIHVRSHLSGLDEGQVARFRTRWERERRKKAEEPTAKPRARRRKKVEGQPAVEVPARPRRRRRTAAEV